MAVLARVGRETPEPWQTKEGVAVSSDEDFGLLYRALYARLASELYAYLADAAEAEDVVQEAFARAWQRWQKVSRYEDPVGWVRRVAWNLATSRWRHLVIAARFRLSHRDRPVPAVGPDHVVLVSALRELPDAHRRAIVLHYIADLSVAQVAIEMAAPNGTVMSWLHRGRVALAAHLGELAVPNPSMTEEKIRHD
jgi:RNA polymerase sigma-70 factor, ECF subfamily